MKTYTHWTAKRSGPAMSVTARPVLDTGGAAATAERLTAVRIFGENECGSHTGHVVQLIVKAELRDGSIVRLA